MYTAPWRFVPDCKSRRSSHRPNIVVLRSSLGDRGARLESPRGSERGLQGPGVAGSNREVPSKCLRDDNAVEWVVMFPGQSRSEDAIVCIDRQFRSAHIGNYLCPSRQQCFAIDPAQACFDADLLSGTGRNP